MTLRVLAEEKAVSPRQEQLLFQRELNANTCH